MAKVANEAVCAPFKFKKPLSLTPPLTEYDPKYLERKAAVVPNVKTLALKSGRSLCYFTEGNPADTPVIWLHGLGESKWGGIPLEPLPGVFFVSVDRVGHGSSSKYTKESAKDGKALLADYLDLLDELKLEKAYFAGHSQGGLWSIQFAAGYPDRVLGVASISAPIFLAEKSLSKADRDGGDTTPGKMMLNLNKNTCFGSFSRWFIGSFVGGMITHADKTKDFGCAGQYDNLWKQEEGPKGGTGGDKRGWDALDKDPFFVTKQIDSNLHGANANTTILYEWAATLGRFDGPFYDISQVKCPTFLYNGIKETTGIAAALNYKRLINGSQLAIFDEHGHISILMEREKIILALLQGKLADTNYPTTYKASS